MLRTGVTTEPDWHLHSPLCEHISHRNQILEVWVEVAGLARQMRGRLLISAMACAADPLTFNPHQGQRSPVFPSVPDRRCSVSVVDAFSPFPATLPCECRHSYIFILFLSPAQNGRPVGSNVDISARIRKLFAKSCQSSCGSTAVIYLGPIFCTLQPLGGDINILFRVKFPGCAHRPVANWPVAFTP